MFWKVEISGSKLEINSFGILMARSHWSVFTKIVLKPYYIKIHIITQTHRIPLYQQSILFVLRTPVAALIFISCSHHFSFGHMHQSHRNIQYKQMHLHIPLYDGHISNNIITIYSSFDGQSGALTIFFFIYTATTN